MNKISFLLTLCITFATCLAIRRTADGVTVIVHQYKYDIPVHHTPPKPKFYFPDSSEEVEEILAKPHEIYGVPKTIIDRYVPETPHEVYGVPSSKNLDVENPNVEVITEKPKIPINSNYKFIIPANEAPQQIGAVAKPGNAEKHLIINYQYEIPVESPGKEPGTPASVYGVPDVPDEPEIPEKELIDAFPELEPGKRALVYGVPDGLTSPFTIDEEY